jgi:hypothetical protein
MPVEFEVPAEGPDIYRNFVIPVEIPEDKWVSAIELRPAARVTLPPAFKPSLVMPRRLTSGVTSVVPPAALRNRSNALMSAAGSAIPVLS